MTERSLDVSMLSDTGVVRVRRRAALATALVLAVAASVAAAVGWARGPGHVPRTAPSIRITDVRPLRTANPILHELIDHTFAVHVAVAGWALLPYRPGATARDNRGEGGHWRLYLDGQSLGTNFGDEPVTYTRLAPGTHWMAAELRTADDRSLAPSLWSEPVVLHVPRVIRCWQTGWRGSAGTRTPSFACSRAKAD